MKHSQDYQNLMKAIKLAHSPVRCRYFDFAGDPVCVIGQLSHIYGIERNEWTEGKSFEEICHRDLYDKFPFDPEFLISMQHIWDDGVGGEEARRANLVEFVQENYEDFHAC